MLLNKEYYIAVPKRKKLNDKQKQWLVDEDYVDSVVLDSYKHNKGWEEYSIKYFDWVLLGKQQYGMEVLQLIDNGKSGLGQKGEAFYEVHLILYPDKYQELMEVK